MLFYEREGLDVPNVSRHTHFSLSSCSDNAKPLNNTPVFPGEEGRSQQSKETEKRKEEDSEILVKGRSRDDQLASCGFNPLVGPVALASEIVKHNTRFRRTLDLFDPCFATFLQDLPTALGSLLIRKMALGDIENSAAGLCPTPCVMPEAPVSLAEKELVAVGDILKIAERVFR